MPRLNIIAKGNGDVRNALHALHENGELRWNGVNEVIRARWPGWSARVIHETMTRTDALAAQPRPIPDGLAGRSLPLGPFRVESQFDSRLFHESADAVVLSIQPDVMNSLVRHRGDGHLLYPHDAEAWPAADRAWLRETYAPAPPLDAAEAMANLAQVISRLRAMGDPHILVFNLSPIVPWERVHSYQGLGETLAQRIRRFNLALTELSAQTGISVIDVDAVVARVGADRLKLDAVSLTAQGCRLVCEEVVRVLADLGCFAAHEPVA